MKIFFDTNVWLSATIFSGLCETLLIECANRQWLITCSLIQTEAHEILTRKFAHLPQAPLLFDAIWYEIPQIDEKVDIFLDDPDKRLVASATEANADLFVTGDKRILSWKRSGSMRIVSPREAWDLLFSKNLIFSPTNH